MLTAILMKFKRGRRGSYFVRQLDARRGALDAIAMRDGDHCLLLIFKGTLSSALMCPLFLNVPVLKGSLPFLSNCPW